MPIAVPRPYKGTDVSTFSGYVTRPFFKINRRNLGNDDLSILKRHHVNLHADRGRHNVADLHHGGKNLLRIKPFHRREIRLFRQAENDDAAFFVGKCRNRLRKTFRQLPHRFLHFTVLRVRPDFPEFFHQLRYIRLNVDHFLDPRIYTVIPNFTRTQVITYVGSR